MNRLEEIYACGEKKDNTHTRIAFSEEDIKGRELFSKYLKELGYKPYLDEAGNLIARLDGLRNDLPPIIMGSHLDTVPDGGKYDGVYGCVGALEVAEALVEDGNKLDHPIEIIVFSDEEGICFGKGLLGSNAMSGLPMEGFSEKDLSIDGKVRKDVFGNYGFCVDTMTKAARERSDVHCFIEMHVEQGRILDKANKSIGVVTAIAGVKRYEVTVVGETNHSGSTMMSDRKDALVAAADFISNVPKIVNQYGSMFGVGTVGKINVAPGSMNVIPGTCQFSLEIREQTKEKLDLLEKQLFEYLKKACYETKLDYKVKTVADYEPAPMDERVIQSLQNICENEKIEYQKLPSGAFHDAMFMSRTFPTGMIFVPSVKGISHAPGEYTKLEDLENGCNLLFKLVQVLDKTNFD